MTTTVRLLHPALATGAQAIMRNGSVLTTDANGQVTLTLDSTTMSAVSDLLNAGWSLVDLPDLQPRLPWVHGRFYATNPGDTVGAVLTVASTIYLTPIFIPNPVTLATIGINFTTGQTGGKGRAALYADKNGAPGAYITGTDTGDLDGTGTALSSATLSPAVSLDPGWYWVATTFAATSTMPSATGITAATISGVNGNIGGDTAAHAIATTGASTGFSGTFTYGALGNNLPSLTVITNATCPTAVLGV